MAIIFYFMGYVGTICSTKVLLMFLCVILGGALGTIYGVEDRNGSAACRQGKYFHLCPLRPDICVIFAESFWSQLKGLL